MNLHSILAVWSPFSIPSCLSLVQEVVERLEAVSKEKKRAENRLVHHEFMPAAMHRYFYLISCVLESFTTTVALF
jgi:hypothetical protein